MNPSSPSCAHWFATEDYDRFLAMHHMKPAELMAFDTAAEADADAQVAVVGEDCEVKEGGMWDPAWSRPQ
jgi:hypothetical protein